MSRSIWASCVALAAAFAVSWADAADDALTNEDIVKLVEAGLGRAVIVVKIEESATAFDTSVDALVGLSKSGVDDEVVAAMVKAAQASSRSAAATPARKRSGAVEPTSAGKDGNAWPKAIPGGTFREALSSGGAAPEMVVIPSGRFRMGCLSNDDCYDHEKPVREVTIAAPFALSVHEVTFEDYDRFAYPYKVDDEGWGRGTRPVINVSWDDAQEYVAWLSAQTGAKYRLPSEAEWEYAARAGRTTKYHWGNEVGANLANCYDDCGDQWEYTATVGSFRPNGFGLHDMHGNVWEWVQDCWNYGYAGAPSDGAAWLTGDCSRRVLRGGSWHYVPLALRAAVRDRNSAGNRYDDVGFRVARTLAP